jgi:hypothetical protein
LVAVNLPCVESGMYIIDIEILFEYFVTRSNCCS